MLKKNLSLFIPILLLILGFFLYNFFFSNHQSGQTYKIVLTDNGFSPAEITLNHGDLIEFTTTSGKPFWPASDLHPTHGIYSEFDPQEPIDPDKSWNFKFLKTGKWKFHDHLNPIFRGTVSVK